MTTPTLCRLIADMRRASRLVDEAEGAVDYQVRCVALALIARQFVREYDAASQQGGRP